MATYHIDKRDSSETKKTLAKIFPLLILASIPALVMVYVSSKDFPLLMIIVPMMMVLAITIGIVLAIKKQSSVVITLDENQLIYRRSGQPDIVIRREEVKGIYEHDDGGIAVQSIDPQITIYAPKNIENFDQFKMALTSWKLIEKSQSNMLMIYIIGIGIAVLAVGAFLFRVKECFYLLIAAFGLFIIYQFAINIKSALVTKDKGKRVGLVLSILILGYFLYTIIDSFIK